MERETFKYTSCYCEENVYWMCQEFVDESYVVFVTNESEKVAIWNQKSGDPVVWDYHVILVVHQGGQVQVYDLDTALTCPIDANEYIQQAFRPFDARIPSEYRPKFRIVKAAEFQRLFASDRSHMRSADGSWIAPPPSYPPIGTGMNLFQWRNVQNPIQTIQNQSFYQFGCVMDFNMFISWIHSL